MTSSTRSCELRLGAAATAIATVVGLLASLALTARRFRGAGTVRGLLTAPLTVPGIVIGIAMLIYFSRVGLGGSFASLLAAHVVLVLPFVVLIVSSGLQAFDRSIEEAARSLGAGRVTAFVTVTCRRSRAACWLRRSSRSSPRSMRWW